MACRGRGIAVTDRTRQLRRGMAVWMIIACSPFRLCHAAPPTHVVVERYEPEVTHDCVHLLFHEEFELLTADSRFLWRASNRDSFQASPLDGFQDAHSAAYHPRLKLYFATDTTNHRMFTFRDPRKNEKVQSVSTIAGVMLEELTDTSYEDLLRQRLFEPLRMTSAGFGAPAATRIRFHDTSPDDRNSGLLQARF